MSGRKTKQPGPPPNEAWTWHSLSLAASMAWRGRSHALVRILDQLEIAHMAHSGLENGRLVLTFDDLERSGIRRRSIAAALREGERRGLIAVRRDGRDVKTGKRLPSTYRLTYLPWRESRHAVWQRPTDDWRRYVEPLATPSGNRAHAAPPNLETRGRKCPQIRGESATGQKSKRSKLNKGPSGDSDPDQQGQNRPYLIYLGDGGRAVVRSTARRSSPPSLPRVKYGDTANAARTRPTSIRRTDDYAQPEAPDDVPVVS